MGAVAVHLPVVVTTAGPKSSQAGADLWVVQGLLATATGAGSPTGPPSAPSYAMAGTSGTALGSLAIVGTEGNGTYTYAVASSSTLPTDLTLAVDGSISGTPSDAMLGITSVEFTVTDGNGLVGNVTIVFTIAGA
jgi:hypothetical protein